MTTKLVAFLDESRKPMRNAATGRVDDLGRNHYVVAAVVVLDGDNPNIRRQLGRVEAGIGHPLHYRNLSPARRVEALAGIGGLDGWDGYLFETARPLPDAHHNEHHVRAKVVAEAFTHLCSEGVVEAVLETRAGTKKSFHPLDRKDHQVMRRLQRQRVVPGSFRIRHDDKTETILQVAGPSCRGTLRWALWCQPRSLCQDQPPCPRSPHCLRQDALNAQRPRDYDPQPIRGVLPVRASKLHQQPTALAVTHPVRLRG